MNRYNYTSAGIFCLNPEIKKQRKSIGINNKHIMKRSHLIKWSRHHKYR